MSRRHCLLGAGDESVWVRDLGSRNGPFVNVQRVVVQLEDEDDPYAPWPPQELHDGDQLKVGSQTFRVRLMGDDSSRDEGSRTAFDPR